MDEARLSRVVERAVELAVFGSEVRRREFLRLVGAGTAAAALASVFPMEAAKALAQDPKLGPLEKKDLKIDFIHLLSKDIWPGHPCCAFAAKRQLAERMPGTFKALLFAILDATEYAHRPENRKAIAAAIAPRNFLNQPVEVVEQVLTGTFPDGLGNMRTVQTGSTSIRSRITAGLGISFGSAWVAIVAAEMLVGGTDIGYFVWNEWNNLALTSVIVAILAIGAIGVALDAGLGRLSRLVAYTE